MSLRRTLATAIFSVLIGLSVGVPAFAQAPTEICKGTAGPTCQVSEVGPFMQGISLMCGNVGTCNLCDIEIVVVNIGNWILGIVGALVLLFYVWGGIQLLASGSGATHVEAGKKSITTATIGLVIVFLAYVGVHTIAGAFGISVTGGTCGETVGTSPGVGGSYVTSCTTATLGKPCGLNQQCAPDLVGAVSCLDLCAIKFPKGPNACTDTTGWAAADRNTNCLADLCSGGTNVQCCTALTSTAPTDTCKAAGLVCSAPKATGCFGQMNCATGQLCCSP